VHVCVCVCLCVHAYQMHLKHVCVGEENRISSGLVPNDEDRVPKANGWSLSNPLLERMFHRSLAFHVSPSDKLCSEATHLGVFVRRSTLEDGDSTSVQSQRQVCLLISIVGIVSHFK
jgi:hypothetical protein